MIRAVNSVRTGAAGGAAMFLFLVLALAGCTGHTGRTPQERAAAYVQKYGAEAVAVQGDVQQVQALLKTTAANATDASVGRLAIMAQAAHDDLDSGRSDFATDGGGGDVGAAITSMYSAVNDLKNAMGGIVAYTGNPNPATEAKMVTQYQNAVAEWNDAVTTIWSVAGEGKPPTV
ncbi:MAG: hypothetical protein ACJ74U_20075 [Jatrophihabitantaceae bacterium]